jgi:hypothetical protein
LNHASPPPLDAEELMRGFPPPPAYRVHVGNWQAWPQKVWSFQHVDELFGTRTIRRGGTVHVLPRATRALDHLRIDVPGHGAMSWSQMLARTHTDAMVVLHRGHVIAEHYAHGMTADSRHLMFSATKSMAGLMAAVLVEEGHLDPQASVGTCLPELSNSAWADARVRDVMDMTDGVVFTEDYADPSSDIYRYVWAMGWAPQLHQAADPRGILAMLATLQKVHAEPRGTAFRYRSPATDVTAWLAMRAARQSLSGWLETRLWSRLGMEHDAYIMLDPIGTEVSFAGMNATARDLARLGQLLLNHGRWGDTQLIPAAVVADLVRGGDTQAFQADGRVTRSGWSYRSQWWVNPQPPRSVAAIGAFGQSLYIYPEHDLVLVKFGSHPSPLASEVDPIHHHAHAALIQELSR